MPSLHIAWACWCAIVVWQLSRRAWVRALGIAHALATAFAVLATGNHFVLDIAGGLLVLAAAAALVSASARMREPLARAGAALRRPRASRPLGAPRGLRPPTAGPAYAASRTREHGVERALRGPLETPVDQPVR
jgi:hypothetical protein